MRRRTRIVATLGPTTDPPDVLRRIVERIDVARINFSHGQRDDHLTRIAQLREAARQAGRTIAILGDLPGPKLRTQLTEAMKLQTGQEVCICFTREPGVGEIGLTEPEVIYDVRADQRILLDDGRLQLKALGLDADGLRAEVIVGGELLTNKGINLPDTRLSMPALTDRDRDAIKVAAEGGVDWLALSFVRGPEAARQLQVEAEHHNLKVPLLAKIERPEAVDHAEAILKAFDGIMVARGDLGVEIPLERVPGVQKKLIAMARAVGKPVVTATDMLDSMRFKPRPTRAEASDVANAIYDGTDAVMLSGETAVGKYPVESVECMHRIALDTEQRMKDFPLAALPKPAEEIGDTLIDAITLATCSLAREVSAHAILTPTISGRTARLLTRHRPEAQIIAPSPREEVVRQMALSWGLWPVWMKEELQPGDDRLDAAIRAAFEVGAVKPGMRVVLLAGHPVKGAERLPSIRIVRIGEEGRARSPV